MLKLNYATTPEELAVLMERMKRRKRRGTYEETLFHFIESGHQIASISFQSKSKTNSAANMLKKSAKGNCINVAVVERGTEAFIINNNLKQEI